MSKNITITLEDDEWELLKVISKTIDFYGDGYDDYKPANSRPSEEIFEDLIKKIENALL